MLVPEGFRVNTVPLQDALSACATEDAAPDAMLVDWGSSQSDGIAVAKGLRRIGRLDAVRLVLIIEDADHGRILTALDAGADACLATPFDVEAVVRAVNAVLDA